MRKRFTSSSKAKKPLARRTLFVISIPRFTKIAFGRVEFQTSGIPLRFPRANTMTHQPVLIQEAYKMYSTRTEGSTRSSLTNWLRRLPLLLVPIMALSFSIANAQQLTGTLSGIAADQTDARIPGARIVVKNEASGDIRDTKADSSGFFSVTALMPGTYSETISSKGFASW